MSVTIHMSGDTLPIAFYLLLEIDSIKLSAPAHEAIYFIKF